MRPRLAPLVATLALTLLSTPAIAEVMDKEPAVPQLYLRAALIGAVGLLLCWAWGWLAVVTLPYTYFIVSGVRDEHVGRAILAEAGGSYVVNAYVAWALAILCHLVGVALFIRRRRRRLQTASSPGGPLQP